MFINASTKEFTLVNNAICQAMASHSNTCYTKRWLPMFTKKLTIFLKTRHIPFQFVNRFLSR